MTADLHQWPGGSFDDLPEVEVRTVLAVPLALPAPVRPAPTHPVPAPAPVRPGPLEPGPLDGAAVDVGPAAPPTQRHSRGSAPTGPHRARRPEPPATGRHRGAPVALPDEPGGVAHGMWSTARVGLQAAVTVFLAVAVTLILVQFLMG